MRVYADKGFDFNVHTVCARWRRHVSVGVVGSVAHCFLFGKPPKVEERSRNDSADDGSSSGHQSSVAVVSIDERLV